MDNLDELENLAEAGEQEFEEEEEEEEEEIVPVTDDNDDLNQPPSRGKSPVQMPVCDLVIYFILAVAHRLQTTAEDAALQTLV